MTDEPQQVGGDIRERIDLVQPVVILVTGRTLPPVVTVNGIGPMLLAELERLCLVARREWERNP